MSDATPSIPVATDHVSQTVNAHVREIIAAAERAAAELRFEVEQEAMRRAADLRADAEREAQQIRDDAEAEARDYLEDARRRVQAFADGRTQRLEEVSGDLLARAEAIGVRLDEAVALRQELEDLVSALRVAAQSATAEARRPAIRLPRAPRGGTGADPAERAGSARAPGPAADPDAATFARDPQPEPAAAPEPPPAAASPDVPSPDAHLAALELPQTPTTSFDDPDIPFDADAHVRRIARDLPRPPRPAPRHPVPPPVPPSPTSPGEPSS